MLHKRSLFNRRWVEGWHSSDNSEMEQCFSLLFLRLHYLQCSLWDPERTVGHRQHQPSAEPELNLEKERKNMKGSASTVNDKYLDTRTVSAPPAHIQSVHHNLSQSSTGHILQKDGSLIKHLKQDAVCHFQHLFCLSARWRCEVRQCCWERAPGFAAVAAHWEHLKFFPPAKTDEPFLCPSPSCLCLLQTKSERGTKKANNGFFFAVFTSEDCKWTCWFFQQML